MKLFVIVYYPDVEDDRGVSEYKFYQPVGIGTQPIKWLAMAACQRFHKVRAGWSFALKL